MSMFDQLLLYNKGFFKPYFNIFSFLDFNQLSLTINIKDRCAFAKLSLKLTGITEILLERRI
jgi:hypothetical protein